jgi:hypothetical protein
MPVWKYRSVEEMPPIPQCEFRTAKCLRRMAEIWDQEYRMRRDRRKVDDPSTSQVGSGGSS